MAAFWVINGAELKDVEAIFAASSVSGSSIVQGQASYNISYCYVAALGSTPVLGNNSARVP
jgi:hypothetical protein